MDQPPTHYQLSFTARQGLLLFVGLLLALALAYFFGLMTGLSGRPSADAAVAPPAGGAAMASISSPAPAATSSARTSAPRPSSDQASATAETTPPAELQVFDDAGGPTPEPSRRILATAVTPPPAVAEGDFWVQVLSVSSEREAKAQSARLGEHHYHTAVLPASTERGKVYRVRVGPYRSREEASRAAERLKTREKVQPWIVAPGQ